MARTSARISSRRAKAVESFKSAADCIGDLEQGMHLFAITRGQFSMIDAILACLDQTGPAALSVWTWTVAEYEVQCLERLRMDERLTAARLIIDVNAKKRNADIIATWRRAFGPTAVRFTINHAKIATIENADYKLLLRGSMNLNCNPRFEQLDISEGGPAFDMIRETEDEMPYCDDNSSHAEVWDSAKITTAFSPEQLELFHPNKVWAK